VDNVSVVRQIEVHTAEPLVPGPSRLEVEIAIAKLKKYKSPGSDQIPAELIQAGGNSIELVSWLVSIEELPSLYCLPLTLQLPISVYVDCIRTLFRRSLLQKVKLPLCLIN
jgi:hypothetical protein